MPDAIVPPTGADAATKKSDPPAASETPPGRVRGVPRFAFVVEVCGPRNENLMCPIDSQVCRGKWARKNLYGKQFEGDFTAMPDMPGICFHINTENRVVKRFDPLADPDNAKLLKRAQRISQALDGIKRRPEKLKVWKDSTITDDLMKTFVFWCRKMVDANLMQVVRGTVPEWPEIRKLPGVIQLQPYDQIAGLNRGTPDDKIRYAKPMPPDDDDDTDEMYSEEIPDPVINPNYMDTRYRDDE